jgi:hypothetical protein
MHSLDGQDCAGGRVHSRVVDESKVVPLTFRGRAYLVPVQQLRALSKGIDRLVEKEPQMDESGAIACAAAKKIIAAALAEQAAEPSAELSKEARIVLGTTISQIRGLGPVCDDLLRLRDDLFAPTGTG